MAQAADQLLRVSMELGGNAPFLVFGDADLDAAVEGAMLAKMRNIGEACTSANRFLVHEAVAEEFAAQLAERMGALHGRRRHRGRASTSARSSRRRRAPACTSWSTTPSPAGARALVGGAVPEGPGYFYPPTVLVDVPASARLSARRSSARSRRSRPSHDEDKAIARANDTEYGLVAYAFTSDLARVLRVSEALEFGMVGINTGIVSNPAAPFGGVKHSGFGREGGFEGIEEYLETKYVGSAL